MKTYPKREIEAYNRALSEVNESLQQLEDATGLRVRVVEMADNRSSNVSGVPVTKIWFHPLPEAE